MFVRDGETGTTERVSVDSQGAQAATGGASPAISADGRFVAFSSDSPDLVAGDTNDVSDVFVHDRTTGATERISVGSSGKQGNRVSRLPAVSADGRIVAFQSEASNLVARDPDATQDIFVRDRQSGTTETVSYDSSGAPAGGVLAPAVSGDGRFVAFTSGFTGFVPNDTNGAFHVFVRDRATGEIDVSFRSGAANLVADDTNAAEDVFVHDRFTGQPERATVDSSGTEANGRSLQNGLRGPAMSADGRYTAFSSSATNLVAGDTNGSTDIFVRDRGDP